MPLSLKYLLHRLQMALLYTIASFIRTTHPVLISGPGAALQLCRAMAGLGAQRVLVVSDAVLVKIGSVAPLVKALEERGIACAVYDGIEPDPNHAQVDAWADAAR